MATLAVVATPFVTRRAYPPTGSYPTSAVLLSGYNAQVFQSIVSFIMIYVIHNVSDGDSAQECLSNEAMHVESFDYKLAETEGYQKKPICISVGFNLPRGPKTSPSRFTVYFPSVSTTETSSIRRLILTSNTYF